MTNQQTIMFIVEIIILAGGIAYIVWRDRRKKNSGRHD